MHIFSNQHLHIQSPIKLVNDPISVGIVPIKEFYDPSTKINYFAMFIVDRSTQVRICFYQTMGKLLSDLPDRVDMEGRIFPYLISGLYDPHEDIRTTAFELIEELG